MSVEEDDPVVSEVNVYVNQTLTKHLYVFQYPNRPACYSRDQQELLKAKIKPVQNKVELELSLPLDGGNYSDSKGESIVTRIECGMNDSYYERGKMDKQILTSKSVDVANNRYAIAVLKDGELHLVPLMKILQLYPDFSYLDKAVIGDQKMAREREGTETEEEEEEARPVQVQIARVKSERAEAARKASYHYQQQLLHEEQWVQLDCFGLQEHRADLERGHLFCSCDDQSVNVQELSQAEFLTSVCPAEYQGAGQISLKEQIKNILINAVVITFSQLCQLLGNDMPSDQVLHCLTAMATLVQCCWVVKSELLYKDGSSSDFNGISCDVLRSARDQMLYCFTKYRLVKRDHISKNIANLPKEEMLQIMEGVSKWLPGQGWQFKLEYDSQFASEHPLLVKQQAEHWKAFNNRMMTTAAVARVSTDSTKSVGSGSGDQAVGAHMITHINNAAPVAEPLTGQDLVEVVKTMVDRTVMKLSKIKQSLQFSHHKVEHKDLLEALKVAEMIEIDCKWLTTTDKEQTKFFTRRQVGDCTDKYRPLLLELLQHNNIVTYKELASKVQERLSEKPPRDTLLRLLKDMCIHKGSSKWMINGSS